MKKFISKLGVICCALAAIIACENNEEVDPREPEQPTQEEMESAFATYQSLDQMWNSASEEASKTYEDTNSVFTELEIKSDEDCVDFTLLVSTDSLPTLGFESYAAYTRIIIDYDQAGCGSDSTITGGSIEIYMAGLLENRWKDSIVFKNVQYPNGSQLDGYRTSALVPDESSLFNRVFQIDVNGTVTLANQKEYQWISSIRDVQNALLSPEGTFERFGTATYTDVAENYSINVTSIEARQRKASCDPAYRYVVKGKETISDNRFLNFQIDYGDGTCDNVATIIPPFGQAFDIEL